MTKLSHLGLAAAISLAFAAPAAAEAPAPMAVNVPIKSFAFMPMRVDVAIGGTVTWKNLDEEPHTVAATGGLFRSKGLDEGDSFSFRFTKPGVYAYVCSIHPQMKATVVVR